MLTQSAASDFHMKNIERIARLMDNRFKIGPIRFGLDSLVGIIPGIGDSITALVSGYMLVVAARRGVPPTILMKMVFNIGVDYVVGLIPILGDLTDIFVKSNIKNLQLLKKHNRTHNNY